MPEYYMIIVSKIFSRNICWAGGKCPHPAPPVSYAYDYFIIVDANIAKKINLSYPVKYSQGIQFPAI